MSILKDKLEKLVTVFMSPIEQYSVGFYVQQEKISCIALKRGSNRNDINEYSLVHFAEYSVLVTMTKLPAQLESTISQFLQNALYVQCRSQILINIALSPNFYTCIRKKLANDITSRERALYKQGLQESMESSAESSGVKVFAVEVDSELESSQTVYVYRCQSLIIEHFRQLTLTNNLQMYLPTLQWLEPDIQSLARYCRYISTFESTFLLLFSDAIYLYEVTDVTLHLLSSKTFNNGHCQLYADDVSNITAQLDKHLAIPENKQLIVAGSYSQSHIESFQQKIDGMTILALDESVENLVSYGTAIKAWL